MIILFCEKLQTYYLNGKLSFGKLMFHRSWTRKISKWRGKVELYTQVDSKCSLEHVGSFFMLIYRNKM